MKNYTYALIKSRAKSHEDLNVLCCRGFPSCRVAPEIRPVEDATEIRKAQEIKTNAKLNQQSVKAVVVTAMLSRLPEKEIFCVCETLKNSL